MGVCKGGGLEGFEGGGVLYWCKGDGEGELPKSTEIGWSSLDHVCKKSKIIHRLLFFLFLTQFF
jgi:hypothetical protein